MFAKNMLILLISLIFFGLFLGPLVKGIYTPPAITNQKLKVYNECINLLKMCPSYERIGIGRDGMLSLGKELLVFDLNYHNRKKELKKYLSEEEIANVKKISALLKKVRCVFVIKKENTILFVAAEYIIFPTSLGVLYSLDGEDPNKIDDGVLNTYKPFINIESNWYTSRKLYASWNRKTNERGPGPLPNSLIDHSLDKSALK